MYQGIQTALSVLFPPACLGCRSLVDRDFALCGKCWRETPFIGGACCNMCGAPQQGPTETGEQIVCDACLKQPRNWISGRAALLYQDNGRRMVLGLKHGHRHEIARMAGGWMVQAVADLLTPLTLIVPVPLHWTRLLGRTFNQSALLARAMTLDCGTEMLPDALVRIRRTASLDRRSPKERQETLEHCMRATRHGEAAMKNRPVMIVDDVMTSGATFQEATRACLAAGAVSVCVVALARAAKTA
jgi:ComF family protein